MKYGIAVIIRKQILKERHKLVFIPFGTIMIETTKTVAMNVYHSVSICIFMNGMK